MLLRWCFRERRCGVSCVTFVIFLSTGSRGVLLGLICVLLGLCAWYGVGTGALGGVVCLGKAFSEHVLHPDYITSFFLLSVGRALLGSPRYLKCRYEWEWVSVSITRQLTFLPRCFPRIQPKGSDVEIDAYSAAHPARLALKLSEQGERPVTRSPSCDIET